MNLRPVLLLPITVLMAACASTPAPKPVVPVLAETGTVARAEAALAPASATLTSGRLVLLGAEGGVRITGMLGGLRPATPVAFHIHETGDCSAVDASSAGPHFNPLGQAHGGPSLAVRHLGDMDNLLPGADGRATVDVIARGVVLGGAAANDILGRALVVHAQADDHHSQPAGNAGARIACGVIRPVP